VASKPDRRRSRTLDVGLVIAALSVLVALGAWLWPRSPDGPDPAPPPPSSSTRGELVGFLTKVLWRSSKPGAVTYTVQWEIRGFKGQACRIG
jgi:hypothetical protein